MKKIYIDVGCAECRDLLDFYRNHKDFIYYGIDPSKSYLKVWRKLPMVNFINRAAWVYDGKVLFYQDYHDDPQGSTLIKAKSRDGFKKSEVECFDFSEWLKQFKGDLIYIDMDIEGAEYDVLWKMINDNTIKLVHKLIYENHSHKFQLKNKERTIIYHKTTATENKLKELNVDFRHDRKLKGWWE